MSLCSGSECLWPCLKITPHLSCILGWGFFCQPLFDLMFRLKFSSLALTFASLCSHAALLSHPNQEIITVSSHLQYLPSAVSQSCETLLVQSWPQMMRNLCQPIWLLNLQRRDLASSNLSCQKPELVSSTVTYCHSSPFSVFLLMKLEFS